jgi:hypothetical protein
MDLVWFRHVRRSSPLTARAVKLVIALLAVNNLLAAALVLHEHRARGETESVSTTDGPRRDATFDGGDGRLARVDGDSAILGGSALSTGPRDPAALTVGGGPRAAPAHGKPSTGDEKGNGDVPSGPGSAPHMGRPLPPPTQLSSSIGDYMKLGGDQVVVVPDGTYRGGLVHAPHPVTDGPYGGWLVLVAEHQGQSVIDMTNDLYPEDNNNRVLYLQPGTSRVMFVGFSFRNGIIRNEAESIRFWYCDHQNADYEYMKAGRSTPRMFQTYYGGDSLEVYGDDMHNGVATAVFFGGTVDNVTIQGVRVYDIDPRFGDDQPGGDPMSHIVPMGSPEGAHRGFRILDTYLEGYYTLWGTNSGSLSDMTWQNIWYGFGYPSPFLLQAVPGASVQHAQRINWQIFGPNAHHSQNGNDPYIYIDDRHYSGQDAYQHRDRIDLTDTNVNYGDPEGVSDPESARSSPSNPANVWRAAHPYESWQSFFGWA